MSSLYKDVLKIIEGAGCHFVRNGKGSHKIWYSPLTEQNFSIPEKTKSKYLCNKILKKDAGINETV